jgi:hypothetical protein
MIITGLQHSLRKNCFISVETEFIHVIVGEWQVVETEGRGDIIVTSSGYVYVNTKTTAISGVRTCDTW